MGYYATKSTKIKNIAPQQSRFETARKSEQRNHSSSKQSN